MKVIDLRNTQMMGWVADVLLSPNSILSVSIPVMECDVYELMEYAASDSEHEAIADPRTPAQIEMDILSKERKETYSSFIHRYFEREIS